MSKLFLPLILFLSAVAFAENFQSYIWLDPALKARGLEEKKPLSVIEDHKDQFVSFDLSGTRIQFFKEIGYVLGDIAGLTQNYKNETPVPYSVFCSQHGAAIQALEKIRSFPATCQSDVTRLIESIKTSAADCSEMNSPSVFIANEFARTRPDKVQYLGRWVPNKFSPEELKLNTLKDYIVVAGAQLVTIEKFPESVVNPAFVSRSVVILRKLWNEEFAKKLETNLQSIFSQTSSLESAQCYSGNASAKKEVAKVMSDLNMALQSLQRLDLDGKAQAQKDAQRVKDAHLCRENLVYPSLSDEEREFLALNLGAVYWRMRGGGVWSRLKGSESGEFYNKRPLQLIGELTGADVGKDVGEGIFNRASMGYSRYMDMGHMNDDKYTDLVGMTKRGYFQVGYQEDQIVSGIEYWARFGRIADAKGVLKDNGFESSYMRVGGAQMGNCYYFAFEKTFNQFSLGKEIGFIAKGGTEIGESCTGAALYLGMAKSLLHGHRCEP